LTVIREACNLGSMPKGACPALARKLQPAHGERRSSNGLVALAGGRLSVLLLVDASPGNVHIVIDVSGYFR
jgi:hypothetical protein